MLLIIIPKNGHTNGLFCCQILEIFYQIPPLRFVVLCCPVVIKDFNFRAISVHQTTEKASFSKRLSAVQDIFHHGLYIC